MSQPAVSEPNFEQALSELDRIVHDLEDGQIGLEDALARYERGVGLIKRCYGLLQSAEQRIVALVGVDANGQAVLEPFGEIAVGESKGESHARPPADAARRKKKPPSPEDEDEALFGS